MPNCKANLAILAIVAKFSQIPKLMHGKSGDLGNCGEYGKTFLNCQTYANKLNTERPTMLANLAILANVTNLAKFRQIAKLMQIS